MLVRELVMINKLATDIKLQRFIEGMTQKRFFITTLSNKSTANYDQQSLLLTNRVYI